MLKVIKNEEPKISIEEYNIKDDHGENCSQLNILISALFQSLHLQKNFRFDLKGVLLRFLFWILVAK